MSAARANRARWWLAGAAATMQLVLSACGGGGSSSTASSNVSAGAGSTAAATAYALNASINGLNASGLVLSVNGTSVPVSSGTTTQLLASSLASGAAYSVTVASQPAGETCTVSASSGTIGSADESVVVTCSGQAYTLGGTINGLITGGLVLASGDSTVTVGSGARSFKFATPIAYGSPYDVTVQAQPLGLTCTLTHNVGTMAAGDVANVLVTCAANTYTVGGSVTGLAAAGLVLADNGADATPISADAATFAMHTAVAYGGHYAVTIQAQPIGLQCTVSNGSGTVGAVNVTNITVACLKNLTIVYSFAGYPSSGASPYGALVQGKGGELYGTTEAGGAGDLGTVFAINPANGSMSLLHSFAGSPADGANPYAALFLDSHGNLYGTAEGGGVAQYCLPYDCNFNYGIVFRINPSSGAESILYSLEGNAAPFVDGAYPYAAVIQLGNGNADATLYATTQKGGASGVGTVFKVNVASGVETPVHAFTGGGDGASPYAGLILASDGNLYGTTQQGGADAVGTIYRINPKTGAEGIVYSFAGGTDGASPYAGLIQGKDGKLYGTTGAGGASGDGTVFSFNPGTGTESVVYSFAGGSGDGANPYAGLIQATDGNLYGTTVSGGVSNDGTVFRINPATGAESLMYAFAGGTGDGADPYGGLLQGSDGNLYGTTLKGGSNDAGTVFKITLQ